MSVCSVKNLQMSSDETALKSLMPEDPLQNLPEMGSAEKNVATKESKVLKAPVYLLCVAVFCNSSPKLARFICGL